VSRFKVLISDYAWPDLEVERRILSEAGATLVEAPRADAETLAAMVADADALMTCWAGIPRAVLLQARRCRIVARLGIGLDNIDLATCGELRIPVTNVPDYCGDEVAEHALALLMALGRKIAFYHWETGHGRYALQTGPPLRRLAGQTLGIVGWGMTGCALARRAACLGLRILVTTRRPPVAVGAPPPVAVGAPPPVAAGELPPVAAGDVTFVNLESLLVESDYVSLHLPLTEATRHLIARPQLRRMKRSAYLINTARGGLVDHAALSDALAAGEIAGAALDVQEREPPDLDQRPYNDPRVIVTPHAAFLSEESLVTLRTRAAQQVAARLRGQIPNNVVNPEVLRD
jgi:D-3-phosphoglycerate dehydrogenase